MRNHLGSYECKLCLTIHNNEGSYLCHTQGKKHQANLARRAYKEAALAAGTSTGTNVPVSFSRKPAASIPRIGRPGYRLIKMKNSVENTLGLLIQIHFPHILQDHSSPVLQKPIYRFMSSYEQRIEVPDKDVQYLVIAALPYDTISFKIPAREINLSPDLFLSHWDSETFLYTLQFFFK
ncbi:CWF complex protein sap62 [Mitosporidium daphniae]